MGNALWFTFAVTFAALLRPDGALVGVALAPALVMGLRAQGDSASKAGEDGCGLRFAGDDSVCGVDGEELAGLPGG